MEKITPSEFELLSKYIFKISGIQLDESKGYLLETRLKPLLNDYGLQNYHELYQKTTVDPSGQLKTKIIDAITINETYFFRDNTPFDVLKNKVIPDLIDAKRKQGRNRRIPIRIWSAACSTGQEVYSIGITLLEMLPDINNYDIYIYGSDISEEVVARASYGKYSPFELDRGLPDNIRQRYFNQVPDGWRIKDEVRSLANFEIRDLMRPFSDLKAFDIVFCRNVAIYFPMSIRTQLFQKIAKTLAPAGSLIVGASESLTGIADLFEPQYYLRGVYYQQKGREKSRATPPQPAAVTRTPAQERAPAVAKKPIQPTRLKTEKPVAPKPPIEKEPSPGPTLADDHQSLLGSLHKRDQSGSSLISDVKDGESTGSGSLLDEIASRHTEDEKE